MLLQKLRCAHFKNYTALEIPFSPQLNFITGPNGAGKTTLLDAIYYLSLTKSAFNATDSQSIQHGQRAFAVEGIFTKHNKSYTIQCGFRQQLGKQFKCNAKVYERLRDHVGRFPVVLTTPYDADLVRGGSEVRRKFVDGLLCQLDHNYLDALLQYQSTLKQRNTLLRLHKTTGHLDRDLLAVYNHQLVPLCKQLFEARNTFIRSFAPIFQQHYHYFVEADEAVQLQYDSAVALPNFEQNFHAALPQDLVLQRTNQGIHRDDIQFILNGHALKNTGSQGQQKSFVIALRLAQFDYLHNALQCKPLLLLDDIFDKLDGKRTDKLVELMKAEHFGQVFITDAKGANRATLTKPTATDTMSIEIEQGVWVQ